MLGSREEKVVYEQPLLFSCTQAAFNRHDGWDLTWLIWPDGAEVEHTLYANLCCYKP